MRHIDRRHVLSAGALLTLAGPWPALAAVPVPTNVGEEISLGSPKARVTVVEYASASCPHCADWNATVFPAFRKKYVDTGRVRYVLREFLTDPAEVAAAGFLLARCAGPSRYFEALDAVFRSQKEWGATGDVRGAFLRVAQKFGMTEQQYVACVSNQKALDALNARVERFAGQDKVSATPTFFVNGRKMPGETSLAQLDAAILAAAPAAPAAKPTVRHSSPVRRR